MLKRPIKKNQKKKRRSGLKKMTQRLLIKCTTGVQGSVAQAEYFSKIMLVGTLSCPLLT
jgi:hypothetical protein